MRLIIQNILFYSRNSKELQDLIFAKKIKRNNLKRNVSKITSYEHEKRNSILYINDAY